MDVLSLKLLLIEPNPYLFGLVRIRNWTKTKVLCSCGLNYNNLRISRNFFNLGAQKNSYQHKFVMLFHSIKILITNTHIYTHWMAMVLHEPIPLSSIKGAGYCMIWRKWRGRSLSNCSKSMPYLKFQRCTYPIHTLKAHSPTQILKSHARNQRCSSQLKICH